MSVRSPARAKPAWLPPFVSIMAILGAIAAVPVVARTAPRSLRFDFAQTFKVTACPAESPPEFTCLEVTGAANSAAFGSLTFRRTVLFDLRKFDKQHPTCIPDETSGKLRFSGGSLDFRAPGSVCLTDGSASYGLIITGGTGAYKGVVGGGRITVPPQTAPGHGRELWQLELF